MNQAGCGRNAVSGGYEESHKLSLSVSASAWAVKAAGARAEAVAARGALVAPPGPPRPLAAC